MDTSGNSFAKHSLKIASASFNQRHLTRKLPESVKSDSTIMSSGMHSGGGKIGDSADDFQGRRKSPIFSSKRVAPTNFTIRELLKRDHSEIICDKSVLESFDLDAKVTVECNHYNQWARTRRSDPREPKTLPLEQCDNQTNAKFVRSIKNEQVPQRREITRPISVPVTSFMKERVIKENTKDLKPELVRNEEQNVTIVNGIPDRKRSCDESEEGKELEGSSVSLYECQTEPISWNSWSGRTRTIPGYVLRDLHRSCRKIIKEVQKASNDFYKKMSSDKESEQCTIAPEKRISSSKRNIVINTETSWVENINHTSLSIRKLPAIPCYQGTKITSLCEKTPLQTCEKWTMKTSEYQTATANVEMGKSSSILQGNPGKEEVGLGNSRKEKVCYGNSIQYKTQFPIAKKEPLLFDNKNVLDFRSKRLENLCKLCEKSGRNPADIKTDMKQKTFGRRRFQDNSRFSITFESFLNMQAKNTSEVKTLNEFNTDQNSSSFRFSINKAEDISGFVKHFGQNSKIANACL